jgi:hypothetical protein
MLLWGFKCCYGVVMGSLNVVTGSLGVVMGSLNAVMGGYRQFKCCYGGLNVVTGV